MGHDDQQQDAVKIDFYKIRVLAVRFHVAALIACHSLNNIKIKKVDFVRFNYNLSILFVVIRLTFQRLK